MSRTSETIWSCSACILKHKNGLSDSLHARVDQHKISLEDDVDASLTLAAEVGKELLAVNNNLNQQVHDLKKSSLEFQSQHEDDLIVAMEEITKLKQTNLDIKKEYTKKLSSITSKAELGIKLNEELIQQNEKDRLDSTTQIDNLNKQLESFKRKIRTLESELSIKTHELEIAIDNDQRSELDSKDEIIKVLKHDLDVISAERSNFKLKFEELANRPRQISDMGLTTTDNFREVKTTSKPRRLSEPIPLQLNNRFLLLDPDFPDINSKQATKIANEKRNQNQRTIKQNVSTFRPTIGTHVINGTQYGPPKSFTSNFSTRKIYPGRNYEHVPILQPMNQEKEEEEEEENPSTTKNKILILADSHGRGLGNLLRSEMQEKYEVTSIFHPNARLHQVTSDLRKLTNSYSKKDFVIVMGGTNDIENSATASYGMDVQEVINSTKNTNLIMVTIPPRYDKYFPENLSWKLNSSIAKCSHGSSHTLIINFSEFDRNDFTRHGLHLNYNGKLKLIHKLKEAILHKDNFKSPKKITYRPTNKPVHDIGLRYQKYRKTLSTSTNVVQNFLL